MVIAKFSEDFSFSELLLDCPGLSPGLEVQGSLGLQRKRCPLLCLFGLQEKSAGAELYTGEVAEGKWGGGFKELGEEGRKIDVCVGQLGMGSASWDLC